MVELADAGPDAMERLGRRLERYRVNVVADRTGLTGAPVVTERFPGRQNLTGSIDRIQDGPMSFRADATTIRGGALLAADGGFLVVHAVEVLEVPGAWVRAEAHAGDGPARHRRRRRRAARACPRPLEPDQVPIDVKVVMVGERQHYDALWHGDPDFRAPVRHPRRFLVRHADGAEALSRYASVVAGACEREHLPPADAAAIGLLVEDGVARAGRRNRVSTSFGDTLVAGARGCPRGG